MKITHISDYKSTLRKLKISHQEMADYVGVYRETMTKLLNGSSVPEIREIHIINEIEDYIEMVKSKGERSKMPKN